MAFPNALREREAPALADRLEVFAMALLVLYAVRAAAGIVPFRPLDTLWQLSAVSALLDSAAIPLLALGLVHLAAYLDPGNVSLGKRRDGLARLAILAVLGFLLLIPLQAFAAWNSVTSAQAVVRGQQATAERNFATIREAILNADSLEDLQGRLQSLQTLGLDVRFENLGLPLAETRRLLLTRLNDAEEQVKTRIRPPQPKAIEEVVWNSLKVMSSSAVFALAFAFVAQRRGSDVPLLVEVHTIWDLRWTPGTRQPGPSAADDIHSLDPQQEGPPESR